MRIEIPKKTKFIIDTLNSAGYEAFVVGGCVRDSVLGKVPHDWDITTSATPIQVKECFPRTVDTGIKHGTVTVMLGMEGFEVTTYRFDGEYKDGRHPEWVSFTDDLLEDLKRRDFTINAMAYNDERGLVDEFGGIKDLSEGVIRCVGSAKERFNEDALRMLRAIRFAARFGFRIDKETYDAIVELKDNLRLISAERINQELTNTLLSPNPDYVKMIEDTGLMKYVCDIKDIERALIGLSEADSDIAIRLAILFKDLSKDEVSKNLKDLRYDNNTIKRCLIIVPYLRDDALIKPDRIFLKGIMRRFGEASVRDIISSKRAVLRALSKDEGELINCLMLADEIVEGGEAYALSMLNIAGNDLIEMGVPRGARIGEILEGLLDQVIANPGLNTREKLITMAGAMM